MLTLRRTGTLAAAGAVAAALGLAGAPAALADGPNTSAEVKSEIMALPWPEFQEGDSGRVVASAQYLLAAYVGYDGGFDGDFDADMTAAVEEYQNEEAGDIPVTGDLDVETWSAMREDYGEVGPGRTGNPVFSAQVLLVERGYLEADQVDGIYGSNTEEAVRAFQGDQESDSGDTIDVDGIVGPYTFRALVTGGI